METYTSGIMSVIKCSLLIKASPLSVFESVATPDGLSRWWTARCTGSPIIGNEYSLWFGDEVNWRALVIDVNPEKSFELLITNSDHYWHSTSVGFEIRPESIGTSLYFYHKGWKVENDQFRKAAFTWELNLELLKRFLETGEWISFEKRPRPILNSIL